MIKSELSPKRAEALNTVRDWVYAVFARCRTTEEFIEFFNDLLVDYQKNPQQKLEVLSMKKGLFSCSSAALVAGLWWNYVRKEDSKFLIDTDKKNIAVDRWHVLTALPCISLLSDESTNLEIENYKYDIPSDISIVDFKSYRIVGGQRVVHMERTPGRSIPENYKLYLHVEDFFANRCDVFNYLME